MLDILEAYHKEFDGPLLNKYRKQIIPLGLELYKQSSEEEIIKLNTLTRFLKIHSGGNLDIKTLD